MRWLLLLTSCFIASHANAEERFGLSMVGSPKYTVESTHLDYANPDAPKGGELKQAATGSFDTLNPYTIKGNAAKGLNLTTDRLMARVWGEPFTLYPLIAKSIDVPNDRSSITFNLNDKARFHDGSRISSEDIIFSFKTLREYGRPNMRRIYKLAKAEPLDSQTVKFTLSGDYDRETVMILAMMPIISKSYWQNKDFNQTTLTPPLGNGPYRIKEIDAGRKITYERVADYWAEDLLPNKGHHNFNEITYDYFRDDSVSLEAFKKGDLSLRREWDAGEWNNSYSFDAADNGDVIKEEIKHGRAEKIRGFIFNTRRPPFDNLEVRKALTTIFDFDWVNKNFFYDKYSRIGVPFLRNGTFFPNTDLSYIPDTSNKKYTTDRRNLLRNADTTLKENGWIIKNGKRIHKDTGEIMNFEILLDTPSQEKIALAYARSLKKMGIEVNVRVMDSAAFRSRINDYDFDMLLYHWNSTLSPGTEQYLYWSCESAKTPSRWNYAGICDPEIDELAKAIPTAKTREELKNLAQNLDKKLQEGQYFVPLYYNPNDYVAYWNTLKRPKVVPLYGIVLETWWMEQQETQ